MNLQTRETRNAHEEQDAALMWNYMTQETNCIEANSSRYRWREFSDTRGPELNSEVYGLKRNMCRMTQTVDMKLETVNPCRKEESSP